MPYETSMSPDITEGVPFTLSSGEQIQTYERSGQSIDIAIGGLPFRLAVSDERPAQRETAQVRRQQFDASPQAGEQSLESTYWLRTQTAWHRGAGIKFYEPGTEEETSGRFARSRGVDVWTPGEISLLKRVDLQLNASGQTGYASPAFVSGVHHIVYLHGNTLEMQDDTGTFLTARTVGGASSVARPFAVHGRYAWVGANDGIYRVDLASTGVVKIYDGIDCSIYYGKTRLWATKGPSVYELVPYNSPSAALPTALYTHPQDDWEWTSMAAAPSAMLAAGTAGAQSAIYRWSINESAGGGLPELGSPIQVAELPPGEVVHAIHVYLGGYIAIGTSRGVRIGIVAADGSLAYGPLTVESNEPVRGFAARDSYIYASVANGDENFYGVVRIDLGQETSPLRFAWAFDAEAPEGFAPNSVAIMGGSPVANKRVFMVVNGSLYAQSADQFVSNGWIESGRVRFGTTQPKAFRLANAGCRFPGTSGSVALSVVMPDGTSSSLYTYTPAANEPRDIAINNVTGEYISVRLDITPGASTGVNSPRVVQWTLKAVPTPRRQRLVSFPVMCFDSERDRYGNIIGAKGSGYAWNRYRDLEALEETGAVIPVQDFTTGEIFSAQVEVIRMNRTTPPDRAYNNFGGVVEIVLRKLS